MKRIETGVRYGVDDVNTWFDRLMWKWAGSAHCKVCDRDMWQKDMVDKTTCYHCDDVAWSHEQVFGEYRYREVDITFTLKPLRDGGFTVTCDGLPELITEGDTIKESIEHAGDALETVIALYQHRDKMGDLPFAIQRLIHAGEDIGKDDGMRIMRDRMTITDWRG